MFAKVVQAHIIKVNAGWNLDIHKAITHLYKPNRQEIQAARGKTVPDVITPGLKVLFCGINPGLYSGATGHHFARPGNRFWKALYEAGFTTRLLEPSEENDLLDLGYGITNLVERATAQAGEIKRDELIDGVKRLTVKVGQYRPKYVAVLGIGVYRQAFERPHAEIGRQDELFSESILWLLPNPSALNGHYQPPLLGRLFRELREADYSYPNRG
jgi:double-stranded uracil-DNA glycosylase